MKRTTLRHIIPEQLKISEKDTHTKKKFFKATRREREKKKTRYVQRMTHIRNNINQTVERHLQSTILIQ